MGQHAERVAWKEAWPAIRNFVRTGIGAFPGRPIQVKIWCDQQICPDCQKWMVIDVIGQLKLLQHTHGGLRFELYVEVRRGGVDRMIRVQRSTVWPGDIGNQPRYEDLPMNYH